MCRKLFLLVCFVLVLGFAGKASAVIYNEDIGSAASLPGSYTEAAGVWTVIGSGHDIWGGDDGLHYVFQPVSGDCTLEINLASMDLTDYWAKVGVMVRETTDAGSRHAAMLMTENATAMQFVYRQNTGGGSAGPGMGGRFLPQKLRIKREGPMLIGEYEFFAGSGFFQELGRVAIPEMNEDVLIGLAVCSHRTDLLCTAVMDQVIWSVTPCYRAWAQSPAEGATGLPQDLTLSWRPGEGATSHDVYLGTNPAALAPEAMGLTEPNCVLVSLEGGTEYFWRVDEHGASVTPGNVWSFKTAKVLRPGTGTILREIWEGIGGGAVWDLTNNAAYPDSPTWSDELTSFDAGANLGDNYGGRMQGWLVPLTAGVHEYKFWIASDDDSELWLSTTEKSINAVKIASVSGWANQYEWYRMPSQESESIWLAGGEKYFIRALWKEGGGGDNCAVAWEGPGTDESPGPVVIDGYYLASGYVDLWAYNPSPVPGAKRVPLDAVLSWSAGEDANSHEVWFGTNPEALTNVATKELGDETYDPGPLELETFYYWQVDEVNGLDVKVGDIWSFKTPRVRPFTGTIVRDVFEGIGSDNIWELINNPAYPDDPTWSDELTAIDSPGLGKDNFGAMMEGYLLPETDGNYRFWIRADDGSALYLSTDDDPANAVKIAGWDTYAGGYDDHPEQASALIPLLAETRYYIRALYKEGGGGDWCSAAWSGPDTVDSRVEIDGYYLMPRDWASDPFPKNGSTLATREPEVKGLSWSVVNNYGATLYDIYLGTSPVLTFPADLIDTKPVGDESCATGPLEVDTTYYWRVDLVGGPAGTIPGHVWSFTTAEWVNIDIRSWGGSGVEVDGVWEIKARGDDIWGGSDSFHFVYKYPRLLPSGDVTLIARVESITGGDNSWRKAGMMVRESLDGGSRHACILMTPPDGENRISFGWRDNTDGGSGSVHYNGIFTPEWVKLVRLGDTFTGFHAEDVDGSPGEWRQVGGPHTVVMPKDVYVGMAVTSHNMGQLTTAVMDNIGIAPRDPQQSWGPSPADGAEGVPVVVRDKGVPIVKLLSWGEGDGVVAHLVWFSDNYDDVASGAPGTLKAVTMEPNYDPGILDLTKTYYWAIDEISSRYDLTLGDIWSFTMSDHRLIDDFERYHVIPIEPPRGVVVVEAVPPDDVNHLVAYWPLDDDFNDYSGNGFDGVPFGDASLIADAERDVVANFDGSDDYVDCGNPDLLNFGTGDWSVCVWINTTKTGKPKGVPYGNGGDGGGGHRYTLGVGESKDNRMTLTTDDNASKKSAHSANYDTVTDGVWHHVVGLREGDRIYIFVDGKLEGSSGVPGGYDLSGTSQHNVLLGAIWNNNGSNPPYIQKFYTGQLDDVRVYDCALSEGEIRYLAGRSHVYGSLIAEYMLEDDASDTSGSELHGTFKGDAGIIDDAAVGGRGFVADFDGNGDYIDLGNDPIFNPGAEPFSISAWFNMDSWGDSWGNIIIAKRGEDNKGWQLRRRGGAQRLCFTVRGTSGGDDPQGNITPALNEWHHVVAIFDPVAGKRTVYLDGEVDKQIDDGGTVKACPYNTYIGARANGGNNPEKYFNGMLDNVRIYKRALTAMDRLYLSEFEPTVFLSDTWTDSGEVSSTLEASLVGGSPHWGEQAIRVDCNGDGEVSRDAPFEDWYDGESKTLVLYFKGAPDNAPEDMYVKITSAVGQLRSAQLSYDGDIDDLKIPVWQEWNIDLAELGSGAPEEGIGEGVPLPHIGAVAIGLTGTGTVLFDDLRLMTTRCVPKYSSLANFNNDCKVDLKDLRVITDDWLYQANDNGLWYEYYEGYYGGLLPYFDVLAVVKQGPINNFDLGVRNRNDGFAFRFTGLIDAPADANYTFYTDSDDGSKLYIGDTQVVDNDGEHGTGDPKSGTIYLTAGKHPITVTMFESGGGEGLVVEVESAELAIPRMPIPDDVLYRLPYPPSDLSEDNTVNFDDYGILADQWLDEVLFP